MKKTNSKEKKESILILSGPTYSNNLPHLGSLYNIILKDQIIKFNNILKNKEDTLYHGFDMHGLPISNIVLKEKYKGVKPPIREFFLSCKEHAEKYSNLILEEFKNFEVNFNKNIYYTNNKNYVFKEIEIFENLLEKKYIKYSVHHAQSCIKCETNISFSEIIKKNSKKETYYVCFPVIGENNTFFLFWTTTWYSIPFSQAICIDKNKKYVKVEENGKFFYVSERFCFQRENMKIINYIDSSELLSKKYLNIFTDEKNSIFNMVSEEIGTEIINMSSDHSLIDYQILKKNNISPRINTINKNGTLNIKNNLYTKNNIIEILKEKELIFQIVKSNVHYDACERCKERIITSVENQLFLDIEHKDLKNKSLNSIKNIKQIPDNNSFYQTLNKRTTWCISRQREWGVFIPSFQCNICKKKIICKDVLKQYKNDIKTNGTIVWLENNYQPKEQCCNKNNFTKLNETFDVWFDSSIAPLYHKNKTNIVLEGNDQYKGWFQVCLLISQSINEDTFSSKILCHGFMKDENKDKLSKSLNNFVDIKTLKSKYGVDAIRMYVSLQDFKNDFIYSTTNLNNAFAEYKFFYNHINFLVKNLKKYLENNNLNKISFNNSEIFYILFFKNFLKMKNKITQELDQFHFHMIPRSIKDFTNLYSNKIFIPGVKKHIFFLIQTK